MASERPVSSEMLKGTLDMMILRTLVWAMRMVIRLRR